MTDQPTPTPRTDAQLLCAGDWGYSEVVDAAYARELERELDAITSEEGELWELRQENSRLKDNLSSLSKLHASEMSKVQSRFERELSAERALADRLATSLDVLLEYVETGEGADHSDAHTASQALAVWKEARRGDQ